MKWYTIVVLFACQFYSSSLSFSRFLALELIARRSSRFFFVSVSSVLIKIIKYPVFNIESFNSNKKLRLIRTIATPREQYSNFDFSKSCNGLLTFSLKTCEAFSSKPPKKRIQIKNLPLIFAHEFRMKIGTETGSLMSHEFFVKVNRRSCAKVFDWQRSQSQTGEMDFLRRCSLVCVCVAARRVWYAMWFMFHFSSLSCHRRSYRSVFVMFFFSTLSVRFWKSSKPHNLGKYTRQQRSLGHATFLVFFSAAFRIHHYIHWNQCVTLSTNTRARTHSHGVSG